MTTQEFYAWCIATCAAALAWLAFGVPGTLCLIAGMIIGNIDVGWIKETDANAEFQPIAADVPLAPIAVLASDLRASDRALKKRWHAIDGPKMVKRKPRLAQAKRMKSAVIVPIRAARSQ